MIATPLNPSVKLPLRDSSYRLRSCRSFAPTRLSDDRAFVFVTLRDCR
jgi:hypothetical protein